MKLIEIKRIAWRIWYNIYVGLFPEPFRNERLFCLRRYLMPYKPASPCRYQRCPNLTTDPTRYCPEHKTLMQQQQDAHRGTTKQRGYGANHQRLRRIVLSEEPLCRHCLQHGITTPSTDMDHIDGNAFNVDRANLQGLCHTCHSRKTAKENGAFRG